jgi:uncharacterized membrane protein YdbT with pleckstrin-like domain
VDLQPHLPPGSEGGCEVFRAGVAYLRYRQLAWILKQAGTLVGILGAVFVLNMVGESPVPARIRTFAAIYRPGMLVLETVGIAAFVLQLPFSWLAIRWDWDCRWYLLSERCLRVQEGILNLKEQTFTLANIQDVQVKQNPLQRLFGLWDVEVRTAGGGENPLGEDAGHSGASLHTAVLKGVERGGEIRDRLLARMAAFQDAGLGEAPARPAPALAAPAFQAAQTAQALAEVLEASRALRRELGG